MQASHTIRRRVGNYELQDELGEGRMARLYLGRHVFDDRRAAIKIPHAELAGDPSFCRRFISEARLMTVIQDPGVVRLREYGQTDDGGIFLAMEYLRGKTLGEYLNASGALPTRRAVTIARQIAGALSAIHRMGIVHRDLEPDNIMLVECEKKVQAKLLDFGIAKFPVQTVGRREDTRNDIVFGTPSYMAPERCAGSREIDHRADIYSLGVILYQMLAGRLPITGSETGEIFARHRWVKPVPLRMVRPEVSTELDGLVMRCLAKKPGERFETAVSLRDALSREMSRSIQSAHQPEVSRPAEMSPKKVSRSAKPQGDEPTRIAADRKPARAVGRGSSPGYAAAATPSSMDRPGSGSTPGTGTLSLGAIASIVGRARHASWVHRAVACLVLAGLLAGGGALLG